MMNGIKVVKLCLRGQCKHLTKNEGKITLETHREWKEDINIDWVSTKPELTQEGKEVQESMMELADEWSRKKIIIKIDKIHP